MAKNNPLKKLELLGQSVWLDYIRADFISSGELLRSILEDGLGGMTSNPSIFEKAIAKSDLYDHEIRTMAFQGQGVKAIYESLSQQDVRNAADTFRPVYEKTKGKEGFVSLEVNPHLAHSTQGTIEEARRLWAALNRPNVLIKVPATAAGLPAIRQLISEGINVNVTLLFGIARYKLVVKSYIAGIKDRIAQGKPVNNIVSVASFFLSRIDVAIDPKEDEFAALGGEQAHFATNILGQVAISSAKIAYNFYKETFGSEQFLKLGASPQKLLWASTSTKDPSYSDVKYVEALIGPDTINTLPPETLEAYRNHGNPSLQLETGLDKAFWVMSELTELGIDIKNITKKLENEGVRKFIDSFDKLMEAVANKSKL